MFRYLTFFILCLSILSCAVSPTGQKQLLLFSGDQMSQMGITAYSQMKEQQKVVSNKRTLEYVRCVTNRLLQHLPSELKGQTWEVNVFQDDSPNAFALPGGKIGVHTGMLDTANSPAMLAAVIGHEIGHVWANHGNARMSQTALAQQGLQLVSIIAGEPTPEKQMALGALGLATKGVVLKYSRKHEKEADSLGVRLMAQAGFDPSEAVTLWQKMAQMSEGSMPEFLSTHPSEEARIKKITSQLKNVLPMYQQAISSGRAPLCRR
ncbi:M48 family metallopeptidase [Pleionea sediminis]|uniref:M48 family metallopeptidase n=1 Tax=Pleionea sediminis TaxID=2569479 RepID=UPI00118695C1|nr:M48 family metallopeptidase [Pleionea sediminis]